MAFLDEARAKLNTILPEMLEQTQGYVPRVLVKEGVRHQEIAWLRSWRRLEMLDSESKLLKDTQITNCSRLLIIGDAGSGKSYILQQEYLRAAQTFLTTPNVPLPCFLDLKRHLSKQPSVEATLEETLRRRYLFDRLSSEHKPGCTLFLDALDERLLTEENEYDFVNGLFNFIQDYHDQLSAVILACRRVFWNPDWLRFSETSWQVYHADDLDREDYAAIIPDSDQLHAFFKQVNLLGISDLLRLPFFGFDLARKYTAGQSLPHSRRDWFQERIREALEGTQHDQADGQTPPLDTLLILARQLACLSTFRMTPTWTEREAINQLSGSMIFRGTQAPITPEQIHTLLQRPLFTKIEGQFSFSHQLFREYLAAEAIASLPLRKQRQLLETSHPNLRYRILTPHRGVAVFLAEISPGFREYLINNDPVIALLAEMPSLSPEADEKLTRAVIEKAIATHRAPWFEIPPRGERIEGVLSKHRPINISNFIRPYLENPEEISLIWATTCVMSWKGSASLNDTLIELAHNDELNVEIRKNAVDAVFASGEKESIQKLYDLLDSKDDQVRGHVLQAFRITEAPTPRDYIAKVCGGAHNSSLLCLLQVEVDQFGLSLRSKEELSEAFEAAISHFKELGNLQSNLLGGLLQQAVELDFDDIPPSLIVSLWLNEGAGRYHYERTLKHLVSKSSKLFERVWNYVVTRLGHEGHGLFITALSNNLVEVCDDHIFELLPTDRSTLNRFQESLIQRVVQLYFYRERTAERLQLFQERAPAFSVHLQLPKPTLTSSSRDPLASRHRIVEVLNSCDEADPATQAINILKVINQILYKKEARVWLEPTEIMRFLADLSVPLRKRVLDIFLSCVLQTEYSCTSRPQENGTHTITMTRLEYAVPFWVLWRLGVKFPVDKLIELIRCYAFLNFPPNGPDQEWYVRLLDELYDLDRERWAETASWLVEAPHISPDGPLQYLINRNSDLYLERCRLRLSQCDLSLRDAALLDYWKAQKPPDFKQVLLNCYQCAEVESLKSEMFCLLLTEDDDWAWNEVHQLLKAGNSPPIIDITSLQHQSLRIPLNPARLPVICDWYVWAQYNRGKQNRLSHTARALEETIIQIGGDEAMAQLRRLQDEKAFLGVEWLSHAILRVEDQMLSIPGGVMDPSQLIEFVNRETYGIVLNERDLFEWTCHVIEDVKDSLERRAEQVHGYWNRRAHRGRADEWWPKTEIECQNILWSAVRLRLSNLSIVGVEERIVRDDRADFWIEKPTETGTPLRVVIELKVARTGYGDQELIAPLQTQLWQQYLEPTGCKHGIFIVLWFKDNNRYPYPVRWATAEELAAELNRFKDSVIERHRVHLACYVIDMTTSARLH